MIKLKKFLSNLSLKSIILGFCFSVGVFSHYIFGADNLAEQIAEMLIHNHTGYEFDFTQPKYRGLY